ncbi:hypothetical protein Gromo_00051 [Candidatus Gromoviella agglomerans]|nr:hypothetical protein Gromo_00051 [Candidatus Gromoviella agglomerans]
MFKTYNIDLRSIGFSARKYFRSRDGSGICSNVGKVLSEAQFARIWGKVLSEAEFARIWGKVLSEAEFARIWGKVLSEAEFARIHLNQSCQSKKEMSGIEEAK